MRANKTVFIVNPNSANGTTGKEWPSIRKLAMDRLGPFEFQMTGGPNDATRLTRDALRNGAEMIICIGGDGTLNEVVNGFMDLSGPEIVFKHDVLLGFIPNGTGCDFARSVPIPNALEPSLEIIRNGRPRAIDIGRLRYVNHRGDTSFRFFHNITSFGIGGEVVDRVNRSSKALGPFLSFIGTTLTTIFKYGTKEISLRLDGGEEKTYRVWNIAVANGQYQGGSMWVAPDARLDDGLFHVTIIGDLTKAEVFRYLPKLYNGKIKDIDKVYTATARRVEAVSSQRVLLDVDGEQPGVLPVEIDIFPGAIQILTAAP